MSIEEQTVFISVFTSKEEIKGLCAILLKFLAGEPGSPECLYNGEFTPESCPIMKIIESTG